ncbi:MAG: cytochrome c [Planctomycetota bacterium]|jgi:soluble cytochrome b562
MRSLLFWLLVGILTACETGREEARTDATPATKEAPPPLEGVDSAYEAADKRKLKKLAPEESPGLHNVFQLSETVISGSEPHGDAAFERLVGMGVKTILSVDGKVPDQEAATRHGMRYVHVPIHYSGISEDELVRIVKTFREVEGPFFVHCFHGKHRGPAAAAVGRLVLDGATRAQALAEMRQWCGTSWKYEGLYGAIASDEMPTQQQTARYAWDFPAAHPLGGLRQAMVEVARHWDHLVALQKRDWKADPKHPDVDAKNEAAKLAGLFGRANGLDEVQRSPEDFRDWMDTSVEQSDKLLRSLKAGENAKASKALRVIKQNCGSCHASYRNQ